MRHTLRSLRRSPGFTVGAVLTLALGVGANAAVFAVVYAVLLNPLPYRQPDRLLQLWETNPAQGVERGDVAPGAYVAWRDRSRTLERVGIYMSAREWLLTLDGEVHAVSGSQVSPSVFDVLGVQPILGRAFLPERPDAPVRDTPEMVLGYGLWQRRFGGARDVIGRVVTYEGRSGMTIVGVMPPGFDFPGGVEAWRQERFDAPLAPVQRLFRYYSGVARLREGRSLTEARAELSAISAALATEFPKSNAGYGLRAERLDEATFGQVRLGLLVVLAVVGCVLLIACANVTNLMLARQSSRRHEQAVRVALGATPGRLLRQRLQETAILTGAGGVAGLALGYWGARLLVALAPADIPRLDEIAFGLPILIFTAIVSLVAAAATGVLPALPWRRHEAMEALKTSTRSLSSMSRSRRWLLAAQAAITIVLLVGSLLLLRSFVKLRQVDLGFDAGQMLTANLRVPVGRYPDLRRPWFALGQHYEQLLQELAAIPGVEAIAGNTEMPLTGEATAGSFWMDDGSGVRPDTTAQFTVPIAVVTPGYFATMRIPVVRGRLFDDTDRLSEEALVNPAAAKGRPHGVVLVNQALADRFWPHQDPVGRAIKLFDHWAVSSSTVVGVVGNVRAASVAAAAPPTIYVPWGELPGFRLGLAVRTRGDSEAVVPAIRARVRALDPQVLVSNVRPMDAVISGALSRPRFNAVLISSFALLALALAAVGIHAVVGYLVVQRTREVGIRMALGARRQDVLRLVLRQGLAPVLAGVVVGAVVAAAGARVMRTLVYEIAPLDPVSFAVAALVLVAVAAAAAFVPARRAARIDPLVALRDE